MEHSWRKECSALLCEAVQARIEDNDLGFESDHWMRRGKNHQDIEKSLRPDRWINKNMDENRDLSWTIRFFNFLDYLIMIKTLRLVRLLVYLVYLVYLVRFPFFAFTAFRIDQRRGGIWDTDSALESKMINHKVTLLWMGKLSCMEMQANWIINRSLLFSLIR